MNYDYPRLVAVRVLHQVLAEQGFSNEALAYHLDDPRLDRRDRSFITALVYGTLDYLPLLDYRLTQTATRPLSQIDEIVLQILRLGCYQILFGQKIPAAAAVNESVRLVQYFRKKSAGGFVNAVLRRLNRDMPELPQHELGVALGLGNELFNDFKQWYGFSDAKRIAQTFLKSPESLTVAFTGDPGALPNWLDELSRCGVKVEAGLFFEQAYHLSGLPCPVPQLPGFAEGLFYVQDEASMLIPTFFQARAGEFLLDGCAGLGGKTIALLNTCPDLKIAAVDPSAVRISDLASNLARLGLDCRQVIRADLLGLSHTDFDLLPENRLFDHVLLDVPCSGLGVLRRKPELKLRWSEETAVRLIELQHALLRHAATLLRPGGRLVYSTCTLNPEENERQIDRFLTSVEGAAFEPLSSSELLAGYGLRAEIGDSLRAGVSSGMLLLRPDQFNTDGFFIAAMRKR